MAYIMFGMVFQVTEEIMAVLKEDDQRSSGLQETTSSLNQLSTQTVFSMLDHLTLWGRHVLQSLRRNKAPVQSNREQRTPALFANDIQ